MGPGAPLFKAWLLISGEALRGRGGSCLSCSVPRVISETRFFAALEEEACILMEVFLSFFPPPPPLPPVWGLGVDPSLQIDVLTELELGESTTGVRQVPGLHNGTKAFLFQGMKSSPSPLCGFSSDLPGRGWPPALLYCFTDDSV